MFSIITWVLNKIILIMTYGYYIRFILQTNQYLLISSIHEIYTMDVIKTTKIISYIFAWFLLFGFLFIVGFITYLSLSSYEVSETEHNKIGELFSGVKMKKKAKFYVSLLVIRRTIFVFLLICLVSFSSRLVIWILGTKYY